METAAPLARALKLEIIPLEGLLETNCGEWQGQSVKKLRRQKVWRSLLGHPSLFRFPGGESIADCQYRMVQVLESLCEKHSPEDLVACFSHSDPLKQLVAYSIGLPLDQFQRLVIDTASITALQIMEGSSKLIMLNYNPNLSWETLQPPIKPNLVAKQ